MRPLTCASRASLVLVTLILALAGAAASHGRPPDGPDAERMSVPGGTAALLKEVRVPAPVEPPRAWLVLARALHGGLAVEGEPVTVAAIERYLADAARRDESEADQVPALLPRALWEQAVFGRPVESAELAFAILRDRRASLLYTGLFSLDPETLAYLTLHPALVSAIYGGHPGVFAAFAESLTIRGAGVVLPGGASRSQEWERLAGAPASDPERFIPALLGRDGGRLAWLFDTLASLDAGHQAFALQGDLARLYDAFGLAQLPGDFAARPFTRPAVDPAILLQAIGVTADGTLAPPGDQPLWDKVFKAGTGGISGEEVNAVWLLRAFASAPSRERRSRLETVVFAQRVFGSRSSGRLWPASFDLLSQALAAYPAHSALMLTLEHLGFTEPTSFVNAARAADTLAAGVDRARASLRVSSFQGSLAVVARLYDVGTIDGRTARDLVQALVKLPAADAGYADSVARWIETVLLPLLPGGPAAGDAEQRLLDGLAGVREGRALPVITWEEQAYRVDVAEGERARLRRIRDRQGGNDLATLLRLRQLRAQGDASLAPTLSAVLSRLGLQDARSLFAVGEPEGTAPPAVPGKGGGTKAGARVAQPGAWPDVLLAELMASYAYAIAIADPDSPMLLAGNPARTHDFEVGKPGCWQLARAVRAGTQLILRGSLLGLERALAVASLRQATLGAPAVAPNPGQLDVQGIAESVATLNPFRLTDRDRDALAGALQRGRERIAAATRTPADLDALAERVGVERWRRRLMRNAVVAGVAAVQQYWSLGEVCAVGQEGAPAADLAAWGVTQRFLDGSWRQALPRRLGMHELGGRLGTGLLSARVADLHLRVAEWLADVRLPAALAPGLLRAAAWDVAMSTQMADFDDWLAPVRAAQALTADRLADHVSALTAEGPLVPVAQGKQ